MLRSHYANKLRRFYANKLRNSLRRLRNSITQIRLRNSPKCHYADYANTDFHYAKIQFITQWATCWWLHDKPNGRGCARAAMIGAITQKLRRNYADYAQITQKLRRLRRNYAYITQKLRMLRRNYAEITQKLRRNYAEITQKLRKKNYAKITRVCVICVISKITHTPFCWWVTGHLHWQFRVDALQYCNQH